MENNQQEPTPSKLINIVKDEFAISKLLAEDVSGWDNESLIASWNLIFYKGSIHDLDLIWIDILSHEMNFRTYEEKIMMPTKDRLLLHRALCSLHPSRPLPQ